MLYTGFKNHVHNLGNHTHELHMKLRIRPPKLMMLLFDIHITKSVRFENHGTSGFISSHPQSSHHITISIM